jgi:ribosomal protein S12 methylthiotransferase accessory factor
MNKLFFAPRRRSKLSLLCSNKTGIINAFLKREELSAHGLHMYQSLTTHTASLFHLDREVSSGGLGVDSDERKAFLACVGESVERYSMSYAPASKLRKCRWRDLPATQRLDDYHLHSKEQYKSLPFKDPLRDSIHWVKLQPWSGKQPLYWPASLVYLPFPHEHVAEACSTGVAAHTTVQAAVLSGLLEVIERDAVMLHFLRQLPAPQLDLDTIGGRAGALLRTIRRSYKVRIYELHHDTPTPVYLAFIWRRYHGSTHFGIGACAHLDSDTALRKALTECLFTYFYSKSFMDLRKTDPAAIAALHEHFLFYQEENFALLLRDTPVCRYRRRTVSVRTVRRSLRSGVYYSVLTTPDVALAGLHVVKVVVPSYLDLNKTHAYPRLGAQRLWSVPLALGVQAASGINPLPHPFP